MAELSRDKCYGCGCDDGYRGMGFYVSTLVPVAPDPAKGILKGHTSYSPHRDDAPERIEYNGILCTRCSQKDDVVWEFALASGDKFADDYLRGAVVWSHLKENDAAWVRVVPVHLAQQRAKEVI